MIIINKCDTLNVPDYIFWWNWSGNWNWTIWKRIGTEKKELKKKGFGIESKGIARNCSGIGIEWKELTPALTPTIVNGNGLNCRNNITFVFGHFCNQISESATTSFAGTSCEVVQ